MLEKLHLEPSEEPPWGGWWGWWEPLVSRPWCLGLLQVEFRSLPPVDPAASERLVEDRRPACEHRCLPELSVFHPSSENSERLSQRVVPGRD